MDNLEEVEKTLEKYNLCKLNQEEIENMNRPITNMEITTVIKSLPTKKTQGQIASQVNSAENLEKNNAQTLPENFRERKTPKLILQSHH